MGESDRYQDYQDYQRRRRSSFFGAGNGPLFWLFAISAMCYLILAFVRTGYNTSYNDNVLFLKNILPNFVVPQKLIPLSERPWTVFIYSFFDVQFLRVLSNVLWLWAFGSIMQHIAGRKKLIPVYLYGAWTGAIFFIIASYIFPASAIPEAGFLLGANSAVIAVAAATTSLQPGYRLFVRINGGIPIWVLFTAYAIISLASVAKSGPHLAAIISSGLGGWGFVLLLRRGIDAGTWMNNLYDWVANLFTPGEKPAVKEKVFYNAGGRAPYSKTANITQQRVDAILDKISEDGYASLSDEEKKILKRASEEDL